MHISEKELLMPIQVLILVHYGSISTSQLMSQKYYVRLRYPFFILSRGSYSLDQLIDIQSVGYPPPQKQNTTLKRCYGAKSNITFSNILKIISNNFYFIKIRKRVKTLFVPYVLWNIIVLISFFLAQSLFPEMMSGANKPIKDFSLSDFIWSFWDTSKILPGMQPYPICFQLWFIRDLMVMSLIAFIVKFVVDRIPVIILIAGFFWIIGSKPIFPGLSFAALFFFSIGAFLSLRNNINSITRQNVTILYLAVIYLVISTLALFVNNSWFGILRNLSVIVGVYLFIETIPFVMNTLSAKTIKSLAKSSFFIYAYHTIPMTIIIRIAVKTFFPDSNFELLLIYFISPILIIITGYYLSSLGYRLFPKLMSVLSGR